MKLNSFREILLKKTSDNIELRSFINSINEDTLHEYVSDLLEKALDPNSLRHRKPNEIVKQFAGSLDNMGSKLLYGHLSHHASKYVAACKAADAESDPQKKASIESAANKHAAAFMTGVSLSEKMSKDASSSEDSLGTNHTKKAPVSLQIQAHAIQPWQRHANTERRETVSSKGKAPGEFNSVPPGFSFKGGSWSNFSYLRKKPHPALELEHHPDDIDKSKRKNSAYPIEDTKLHITNNETGEKSEHHININPDEKFSGKFEPHIMDAHPIFGMHDHDHTDTDHFMIRNGDTNQHPHPKYGGFIHTPQSSIPKDGEYVQQYNDNVRNFKENILRSAVRDGKSYKGNPIFRDFATQKSSQGIPLKDHTDEEKQAEQAKLINYIRQNPQTSKVIFSHHPELKSLAMGQQPEPKKSDVSNSNERPLDENHEGHIPDEHLDTLLPELEKDPEAAKSFFQDNPHYGWAKKMMRPQEGEEGHIPDEHLDQIVPELEKDPEAAKKFFEDNPHYGWAKNMMRPQEGEEGHISDEHLDQIVPELEKDPEAAKKFFEDNPHYSWAKRRLKKQEQPQETEEQRVQRQIKEIMGKTSRPKVGVETLLKSISFLLKKNESFFNQNPELFIAVQERFIKAVTDEEDQQDEDQQDQQELQPEDLIEAGRGFNWDDPEAEQDPEAEAEDAPKTKGSSGSRHYDTKHLSEHGAKYLGLGENAKKRIEVMHDPDVFSLIRGPAEKYLGSSGHSENLTNEKNTIKHAGAKINSSEETKAHQSRAEQKKEAWKSFKNSEEYKKIADEHAGDPDMLEIEADIAFHKKWEDSGEHGKDLEAAKASSASATDIHSEAENKQKTEAQNRQAYLRGDPIKPDDTSGMKLDPDFKFNHSKTVDGKEHHDVLQGQKKHGTVVHDPKDPSKTEFVPGEKSAANPNTVMAAFKQEKGLDNDESSNIDDLGILHVAPFGYSGVEDIAHEGEAKANIYGSDGDEGVTTNYRQGSSSSEYFKQKMQGQKPAEDKFNFQHNRGLSAGSVAHHDVFAKDQNNQPAKVGTIVHDAKDSSNPKFVPHGQSTTNPAEAISAFKSKGVSYTQDQIKSMLSPEQHSRLNSIKSIKASKGNT